jgi:hypothetical protein
MKCILTSKILFIHLFIHPFLNFFCYAVVTIIYINNLDQATIIQYFNRTTTFLLKTKLIETKFKQKYLITQLYKKK